MLNHFSSLPEALQHALFALVHWLHIVCTTLLVGGTLFYEFVIPKAIEDLKEESQLAVLGRVRWFFRGVVILCAILLFATGGLSIWFYLPMYTGAFEVVRPWLAWHVALGTVALIVAVIAMARTRSPRHPLIWMRINFVILLITIFVASLVRHIRLTVQDDIEHDNRAVFDKYAHPDRQ
jgi:uncharacterized membrane protein